MIRRLLSLLTFLSLLLCVAASSLWVRSYAGRSAVQFDRRGVRWEASSDRGVLRLDNGPQRRLETEATARERGLLMAECVRLSGELRSLAKRLALTKTEGRAGLEGEFERVRALTIANRTERAASMSKPACTTPAAAYTAPHFAVAAGAGTMPVVALSLAAGRARRRRSRLEVGRCAACGYNLRGNVSGVCPECGETRKT